MASSILHALPARQEDPVFGPENKAGGSLTLLIDNERRTMIVAPISQCELTPWPHPLSVMSIATLRLPRKWLRDSCVDVHDLALADVSRGWWGDP